MSSIPAPTLEEVWQLFKESDRRFQETERLLKEDTQETKRLLREETQEIKRLLREEAQETERRFHETERRFQETEHRFQETERLLKEQSQETDRRFQETDRRFRETERWFKQQHKEFDKKLGKLGNRLGEFVEEFIKPSVVKIFQERGIAVHMVTRDVEAHRPELGLAMQIDLFVTNDDSCVLIEVKSHLSLDDVNEHVERMGKFKVMFPLYAAKKVYGAVAGMVIPDNVARYAYRQGFFVIAQRGEMATILNDEHFDPAVW